MTVRVTADGLNGLVAHLEAAGRDVAPEAKKVLGRAGFNVKRDAQKKASGIRHAPHYPRAIGYDVWWRGESGHVVIGPDKDKPQGPLGNILEYGTSNNPPYAHLGPALDYEAPAFERYMGELAAKLLS